MNITLQRWYVWSGIAFFASLGIGFFVLARLFPLPSPHDTAEQIAAYYSHYTTLRRLGLQLAMLASPLWIPFVVVIWQQMKRIEGGDAPLALVQLLCGSVGTVSFFITPVMMMQAAAFRPDQRPPQTTEALSDLAWLTLAGAPSLALLQLVVIAVAIFRDTRTEPVFPRWVGYFSIWTALAFAAGMLVVFFKTGPFAWNGILGFWLPLAIFGAWLVAMAIALLRAIAQEEDAATQPATIEARQPKSQARTT